MNATPQKIQIQAVERMATFMPKEDDLILIVLRGHLLIEEQFWRHCERVFMDVPPNHVLQRTASAAKSPIPVPETPSAFHLHVARIK
jgi:hypothetical protein